MYFHEAYKLMQDGHICTWKEMRFKIWIANRKVYQLNELGGIFRILNLEIEHVINLDWEVENAGD